MRKLEKTQIIKNVGSSWFSLGLNILVGLFLSPFILHKLGDAAFGIWVLIFSVTGYYGIFDFGIRSSIVRYVSKYTATGNTDEINGLINTAMFTYAGVGLLSLLITVALCLNLERLFPPPRIPQDFQATARWLLFIVGSSVALGFPLGVFGGMLEGLQKFYIINFTNILFTSVLRVVLIVFYLKHGYGLLTVALITVGLPLVGAAVRAIIAMRALPITFSSRYVTRDAFRQMANYSGVTFMILIAWRLRFKTDAMVIGTFLSSAAITYFYAGSRLVDYAGEVVSSLAQIFVPMSSQSDAAGNMHGLRKIFVVGNRACAFTMLPITTIFIVLGKSLIEVWVGKRYVAQGYAVLLTLLIPYTLMTIQGASSRILFGMSKHGKLAVVTVAEGAANLVLSILLVQRFGILGDAFGTAIPLTGTYLLFVPYHLCSRLGVRLWSYVRHAYLLPALLCVPMAAALLLMKRWFVPHTYRQLVVHLVAGGIVYATGLAWAYKSGKALQVGDLRASIEMQTEVEVLAATIETLPEDV
jgi:O-antigen/teichoic acid export membrane protein